MTLDRITVSVIQHRLESIVQEMGEAMLRTSYSQILNSSRDFSTAVFDGAGRLAAQAEHVPIHVGALPMAVKSVADYFAGRIRPGDMFLLNDPYHGGNHLPDLTPSCPCSWASASPSGPSIAPTRATSAAPPTAPTTPGPRRSGRKASASPRSSSTTQVACATT